MQVRDMQAADRQNWLRLWKLYNDFYQTRIAEDVTDYTWKRILDPNCPIFGRVVEVSGTVAGFSVSVLHEGTWVKDPICYLEDLYVDSTYRGAGAGRALIVDLIALARKQGWSRVYWHTKKDNAVARHLYDSFTPADDFVRYCIFVAGANDAGGSPAS